MTLKSPTIPTFDFMQNNKINWGIIGAGRIAQTFADDLKLSPNAVLRAIASRNSEKAQSFAQKNDIAQFYDSYQALAKDPDIDVIYIATPHPLHYENTLLCIENGKHVLCEKPMGMNASQVKRMTDEAKAHELFLMEAMWTRFIPATEKLIAVLDSGVIGNPLFLHADFGFKSTPDPNGRLFNKKLGGGSLLDIGIYPIFLSLLLWGKPNTIRALARMTETGVDSYCSMVFDHNNAAKSMLESTFEANTPVEAIIYGEKGTLKLHRRWHHATMLSVLKTDGQNEEIHLPYKGSGYIFEIEEVNRCLQNGIKESNKMPHRMSLDLIETIDRVKAEIGLAYDEHD